MGDGLVHAGHDANVMDVRFIAAHVRHLGQVRRVCSLNSHR